MAPKTEIYPACSQTDEMELSSNTSSKGHTGSPQILQEIENRNTTTKRQASRMAPNPVHATENPRAPDRDTIYLQHQCKPRQRQADETATGTRNATPCYTAAGFLRTHNALPYAGYRQKGMPQAAKNRGPCL
ncbi:Hypothetical predicted protein [Pelobates cultripes]|uniref:Uncharacterized protein n=1 Tax=Pelobates cultripes TaxID=61616 RepID=A0AAD1WDJ8_PELCU|nr:Hypothetical predicted protein [Pelobates cultripes]